MVTTSACPGAIRRRNHAGLCAGKADEEIISRPAGQQQWNDDRYDMDDQDHKTGSTLM
jgi:hypothetical protein